ncbi:MAG: trigger factor [Phycisphaerales bacterium]|nr:trigger factor [Phycisphaerales bacterium]
MATTTETTEELALDRVDINDAGAACKKITVEISSAVIDDRMGDNFTTLTSEVRLPGFRPGKAPRKLVERRFAKGVAEETRNRLMREAVEKVVRDNKFKVIGNPVETDEKIPDLQPGKAFKFTFEIEVLPDFELPKYDGVPLRRPTLEVTREMVDKELKVQQERRGTVVPVEGTPEPGDYFFGSAKINDREGNALGTVAETVSRLPLADDPDRGPIGGIQIEGLRELLGGKTAGETVSVETTGPENHELEAVRGKPITIEFNIANVGRLIPATMEQLLAMTGLEIEGQLRERLERALQAQIAGEQQDILRRQVAKYLLENTEMDLPQRASAAQTAQTIESFRLRMLNQGMPAYLVEERMAEIREAGAERAAKDLKLMFIMEQLCEAFDIKVTEDEINGRIAQIAMRQNTRPEKLRQELIRSGRGPMLVNQLRHEKAADRVIEMADVTAITAEEWNKEMEAEREAARAEAEKAAEGEKSGSSKKETGKKKPSPKKKAEKDTD